MRIKVLMMSSLLLLALFAVKSYSIDWDNPSQSADDLISSGNGYSFTPISQQAQAARAAEMGQSAKDILGTSTGSKLSSGATSPKEARSQDQNTTVAPPAVAAEVNVPAKPTTSPDLTIVSGSWSLELNDSSSRKAILTLFQNGDAVYGTGNLDLDANTTMMAAASGTVTGDQVNLDVVSLGKVSLYRISMTVNGDSAAGSYTAFSPGSAQTTGTTEGLKLA
jgi:hypothetical protein